MNAKIDYQTTVTNTLIADSNDMANDASNYSVNPGKDFTRKRKLDFYNLIMFLIIMGNSNVIDHLFCRPKVNVFCHSQAPYNVKGCIKTSKLASHF